MSPGGPRDPARPTRGDYPQVRRHVEAVVVEAAATLESAGETGKVRPVKPAMQPWLIQIAVYYGNRPSRGCERHPQAKTDRGPPHSRLRASNDHAPSGLPQGFEVLRERANERPTSELGAPSSPASPSSRLRRSSPGSFRAPIV
jgi:hypothetical protein